MTTTLQARVYENHLKKVAKLKAKTGLTTSQLFRELISAAEVKPVEMVVNLPTPTTLPTGSTPEQI